VRDFVALGVIILCAGGIRLVTLTDSLWWDELTMMQMLIKRGLPVAVAYAGGVANHVMNSLLTWMSVEVLGMEEIWIRLPAFLMGVGLPIALYLALRKFLDRTVAIWAAFVAIIHFSHIVHSTQARGYSGGICWLFVSSILFTQLIRHPTWKLVLGYVVASTLSMGFLFVSILAVFAQGVAAGIMWLSEMRKSRQTAFTAPAFTTALSALWAAVLSFIGFGVILPQVLNYTSSAGASRDHLSLGTELLSGIGIYLTGANSVLLAVILLGLSLSGWIISRDARGRRVAFLAPCIVAGCWLLKPGAVFSPRLFFFLMPSYIVGLALCFSELTKRAQRWHSPYKLLVACLSACILLAAGIQYRTLVKIGNPDLKALSKELEGSAIALAGQQADVNVYYFPSAAVLEGDTQPTAPMHEAIIVGLNNRTSIDPDRYGPAYVFKQELASWSDHYPCFHVYTRTTATDNSSAADQSSESPSSLP